jgi:phosphoserine phosphatase RsbU/P
MGCTLTSEPELEALRRQCADLQRQIEQLRAKQQKRLSLAADVHRTLLPQPVRHDRLWVDVRYIPVDDVGGDYCQVRFPDRNTCYITMCDVMGHGVGPALLATRISSEVRYEIMYRREPKDIVDSLQRFMVEYFGNSGLFLTFVAARIDLDVGEVTWSGAGHPSPLLLRAGTESAEQLESQNPLLGIELPGAGESCQSTVSFAPGDRLLFYTDGLFEVVDASDRQLGMQGLVSLAQTTRRYELFAVADQLLQAIREFQAGPDADDQTLVVAEMRSAPRN